MKYKLDISRLKAGDIILAGYNDKLSEDIRKRTNSLYSHAMLYCGNTIVHSADIVITENPSRQIYEEGENVCVLRLNDSYWNPYRIEDLIKYAISFVGTLYDKKALSAMRNNLAVSPNPNRQMCSKFIAQCFEYVAADLVDDYDTCSPQDLINHDVVDQINDVLIEATQFDEEYAKSPDVTKIQYDSILKIIKDLQLTFPDADIMSIQQLEDFLKHNPDKDRCIVDIMSKTDYFNLWAIEREYCSYLYSLEEFKKSWMATDEHARNIVETSNNIINACNGLIEHYKAQIKEFGDMSFYEKMIELQKNIITTATERIRVAESFLMRDGGILKLRVI